LGIQGVRRGKTQRTTRPDPKQPYPLDWVNRQFVAERLNQLWMANSTYVSTWQGFTSRYSERLTEARIDSSGDSDSYDNALVETINGLYKAKVIHRWPSWKTIEAVEIATLEWVMWFNHQRPLEPIGYIPPAEAEENYYARLKHEANEQLTPA
jgi:putative transposase